MSVNSESFSAENLVDESYFFSCSVCPQTTDCPHFTSLTIEPKLSKVECRPAHFQCIRWRGNPGSSIQLANHLIDEHDIMTKFRCPICRCTDFNNFASASHHRRYCDNALPAPTLRNKARFAPDRRSSSPWHRPAE